MAQQWYPAGARPRILINWQSFIDQGIPANWQWPFVDAVINAYTRWMTTAAVDLRFQFWGFTDRTESNDGELVISMNRRFADRLASTFGYYNRLIIIFHRRANDDVTLWNFVPQNAVPGEIDMQSVLVHELGHCLGLDHSASGNDVMYPSNRYHQRYGPFPRDVAAVKTLYPNFGRNRVRQLRSADSAATWSPVVSNLTNYNHPDARTTTTPGAVHVGNSGQYVVGWSIPNGIPTWLRGDGATFNFAEWVYYGGERSVYGPAYASDSNGRLLWAWVHNDTAASLRMVGSTDGGRTWFWVGTPPGATTAGVPALCWTRVGGRSTWICVWVNFEWASHERTGLIYSSTSTDDGWSWTSPVVLHRSFKALAGVSAAAGPDNQVAVAFALAPTVTSVGMNGIRTLSCEVAGGQLAVRQQHSLAELTRIQPALAYDPTGRRFVLASREQNFLTTIASLTKGLQPADPWTGRVFLGDRRSHTAPALAAAPGRSEIRLYYGYED